MPHQATFARCGLKSSKTALSFFDLPGAAEGEPRGVTTGILRSQRVESVVVEVVQDCSDPIRRGKGHLGDLSYIRSLSREQHHLGPTSPHHRARRVPYDLEQSSALLVGYFSNACPFADLPSSIAKPTLHDRHVKLLDATLLLACRGTRWHFLGLFRPREAIPMPERFVQEIECNPSIFISIRYMKGCVSEVLAHCLNKFVFVQVRWFLDAAANLEVFENDRGNWGRSATQHLTG